MTLVVTRHRLAAVAAVAAGFPLAVAFFAAHWLPEWSALSDPLTEIDSPFSYVASTMEIAGGVVLGLTGLAIVRARGLSSFAAVAEPG